MSFSKNNSSIDPYEGIYFQDFLKNGLPKHNNIKGISFIIFAHLGILVLGVGCYAIVSKNILPKFSFKFSETEPTSSVNSAETYSLVISQDSITLNLDENETSTVDVSANNTEKSFKLNCDYSDIVSVETVSNNNGIITHKVTPLSIGTGYLEYKLIDSDNESIVYDTKKVNVTAEGTLSTGTFNNHFYQVFDDSMTWTEAKAACEEAGGHLATINSSEEQDYIQQLIKSTKKDNIWIGGNFSAANNSWSWVDNTEWDYTNWDASQPDNFTGDEYYLRIKHRDRVYEDWEAYDGKWNDIADSADGAGQDFDVPISSFGYICEWDYIKTPIIGNLKPTNDVGYNSPEEITDCFGNNYNAQQAFSITFSGRNECRAEFDFNGVDYRTLAYDVSIANTSREKFANAQDYSFESDFPLCDMSLVAIQSDGSETNCNGTGDMLIYGFFNETVIHHTVALPEGTVAIRFEGNAMQSYAGVKVIIANATLTTEITDIE